MDNPVAAWFREAKQTLNETKADFVTDIATSKIANRRFDRRTYG